LSIVSINAVVFIIVVDGNLVSVELCRIKFNNNYKECSLGGATGMHCYSYRNGT